MPEMDFLARTYLKSMKDQLAVVDLSMFGFTAEELAAASLGGAFTIYAFDKNGKMMSDDGLAYPVFYDGEIVAILEIGYGSDSKYHCTFGKAYAQKLNDLCLKGNLNAAKGMIIGRIADKFFLTDGEQVEIILDKPTLSQTDSQVAAVNKVTGKVTGKKAGTTVVKTTVRFVDGGKEVYQTKIYVKR